MFTAALFTKAQTWKQPKCPPKDEWIKKMQVTYTSGYTQSSKTAEYFNLQQHG